jgi:hypothetical protein
MSMSAIRRECMNRYGWDLGDDEVVCAFCRSPQGAELREFSQYRAEMQRLRDAVGYSSMGTRAYNTLMRRGVATLADLHRVSSEEVKTWMYVGGATFEFIERVRRENPPASPGGEGDDQVAAAQDGGR